MASKLNTSEYSYCSARIRALENSLLSIEKMRAIAESADFSEAINKISEYGVELIHDDNGGFDCEATLQNIYTSACKVVERETPRPEIYNFLRYPYDCNNLKACIKCSIRDISPDSMLYDCGTCTANEAKNAVAGEFFGYPENMSSAIIKAQEAFDKTKNPQAIDMILDKACYADMLECAGSSGCEFFIKLVKSRIDIINITTCIRLLRMKMGFAGRALLADAVLAGGNYDVGFFAEAYDGGESRLCDSLAYSDYNKFIACVCEHADSLSEVEKFSDDMYMELVKDTKFVAFGPEIPAAYLIAMEYEVKNLRIILDGKKSGKTQGEICERLRCSYV